MLNPLRCHKETAQLFFNCLSVFDHFVGFAPTGLKNSCFENLRGILPVSSRLQFFNASKIIICFRGNFQAFSEQFLCAR